MIPKKIHYVWPGRDEKKGLSKVCIETWHKVLPPDWELVEWNLDTFDFEKYKSQNRFFKEVCDRKFFAYIADYVRALVLYEHGGIYLDTDVSLLKPFDEEMLNNKMFLAIQNERLVEPAVWGTEAGHPFIKEVLDFYDEEFWNCSEFTMPDIFAKLLKKKYGINGYEKDKSRQEIFSTPDNMIAFYPEKYFIPYRYGSQFLPTCVEPETTTIHWFRGSWLNDKNLEFLMNKGRCPQKPTMKDFLKKLIKNIFSIRFNLKKKKFDLKILGVKIIILE